MCGLHKIMWSTILGSNFYIIIWFNNVFVSQLQEAGRLWNYNILLSVMLPLLRHVFTLYFAASGLNMAYLVIPMSYWVLGYAWKGLNVTTQDL